MNPRFISALCLTAMLTACSDGGDNLSPSYSVDPTTIDVSQANYCDNTQPALCLFPFPSDFFTRQDSATPTGKRVNFDPRAMPVNQDGVVLDPGEHNRNDGFSIGPTLVTYVEGLDLEATAAATRTPCLHSSTATQPLKCPSFALSHKRLFLMQRTATQIHKLWSSAIGFLATATSHGVWASGPSCPMPPEGPAW